MIGKHLSSAGSNRAGVVARYTTAGGVSNLCSYITNGKQRVESKTEAFKEKVLFWGAANFNFNTYDAQVSEMIATTGAAIAQSKRTSKPIEHYVFSWRNNEEPTRQQVEEAVSTFVAMAKMEKHQYIWGVHGNTENLHVHIALSRVDPDTLKIERINNGFDKRLCQQVAAKLEVMQGWETLQNNVFKYDKDTNTFIDKRKETITEEQKIQKVQDKLDLKARAKSLCEIFKKAESWQDLHDALRVQGAFYAPRRGGAVLRFTGVAGDIKASEVTRDCSMAALKKRFGDFKEDINRHKPSLTKEVKVMNIIQKMASNGVDKEALSNSRTVWAMRDYFGKDATEASIFKKLQADVENHGMKVEQAQVMEMSQAVYGALHEQKEQCRQQRQEQELAQRAPRDTLELLLMLALALFGMRMATQFELEAQQEAERQALLEDAEKQGISADVVETMVREQEKRHQLEREHIYEKLDSTANTMTKTEQKQEAQETKQEEQKQAPVTVTTTDDMDWAKNGMKYTDTYTATATRIKVATISEGEETPSGEDMDRLVAARLLAIGHSKFDVTNTVCKGIIARDEDAARAVRLAQEVVNSVPADKIEALKPHAELWQAQERQDVIANHARYERQGIEAPSAVRKQAEKIRIAMDSGQEMQLQ